MFGSLALARMAQDGSEDERRVCLPRGRGCCGTGGGDNNIYIVWIFHGMYALIRGSTGAMGVGSWNQVNQGSFFPGWKIHRMGRKKGWVMSKGMG